MAIAHVPVDTNPQTRESRLYSSTLKFVGFQLINMIRMYAMYRALKVFVYIGTVLSVIGILPILRFLLFYFRGEGAGHIQSLILGGVFLSMGFFAYLVGLVADLISNNRQLVEMTLERARRAELDRLKEKAHTKDD